MAKQVLIITPEGAAQALQVQGNLLRSVHAQLFAILRSRLGQNHGDFLALPTVLSDGRVEWSTTLSGPVVRVSELADDERARVEKRAERIGADILALAAQLQAEAPASQWVAHMLERAVLRPPGDWLYSVDGKPVLALWGHVAPGQAPPDAEVRSASPTLSEAPARPAEGRSAVESPGAAHATAGPPVLPAVPPAAAGGAWRWVVVGLAVAALLALLLAGLRSCARGPADAGLAAQIEEAERRNAELEQDLRKKGAPAMMCVPDEAASAPQPAASEPEPAASTPSAPEPVASAPSAPPPDPMQELKKKISEAGSDCKRLSDLMEDEALLKKSSAQGSALRAQVFKQFGQKCQAQAIKQARNLCPGQRPPELAPEVALVFDASGSMAFSLNATEQEIRNAGAAALESVVRLLLGKPRSGATSHLFDEPTRMTAAKEAAAAVVKRLPSDVGAGLVMIEDCPGARTVGKFGPGQKGALLQQVQGIGPRSGTPLADGIEKGGNLVDGTKRDAVMVVISDGAESCGRDPCAVAAELKKRKPYLRINVVDITGTGAGNCVAKATGGQVFTASSADDVLRMTRRAAQDAMGPQNCSK